MKRSRIAARRAIPEGETFGAEPSDDIVAGQRGEIAEGAEAPLGEHRGEFGRGIGDSEREWGEKRLLVGHGEDVIAGREVGGGSLGEEVRRWRRPGKLP